MPTPEELAAYRAKLEAKLAAKKPGASALAEIKKAKARDKIDKAVKRKCGGG